LTLAVRTVGVLELEVVTVSQEAPATDAAIVIG